MIGIEIYNDPSNNQTIGIARNLGRGGVEPRTNINTEAAVMPAKPAWHLRSSRVTRCEPNHSFRAGGKSYFSLDISQV